MSKVLLIRDSREHEGHGYDWGEDDFCRGTKIEALNVGDYSIENLSHLIFIDRKQTVSELAKNIVENRFVRLLEKAKNYKYKFIICEFSFDEVLKYPIGSDIPKFMYKKMRVKSGYIQMWISKIFVEYGVSIIFAGDAKAGEKICYSLLKTIYKNEVDV